MLNFSRKQQQILLILSIVYGLGLLLFLYADTHAHITRQYLVNAEPPDLRFYLDAPINVNLADAVELQLLPEIGPILAQRIIAYRQRYGTFRTADGLQNVRGIGPKTVQKLRYYLTFSE